MSEITNVGFLEKAFEFWPTYFFGELNTTFETLVI